MEIKNKNFILTKDPEARKILMDHGLTEMHNNDGLYIFINEPKKLTKFNFESLSLVFTNKMYF